MEIAVAPGAPVGEFNAQFECCAGRLDESGVIDLSKTVEQLDRGNRRLSDTDRSDLIGFDEGDRA
jgi:hypothetical protein